MNQPTPNITIEALTAYSLDDATVIGQLLSILSNSFDGRPVNEQVLTDIIASPYHDQLVARDVTGKIVGTLTVSLTMGAGVIRKAWLEDFIVDPTIQGMGIGSKLWDAAVMWCQDQEAKQLCFTSRPSRTSAHDFYTKRGAITYDTTFFKKAIS